MSNTTESLQRLLTGMGIENNEIDYVSKFGQNPDCDASVVEDVWYAGGTRTKQTTNQSLEIVSSSASDVATSGVGARKVVVYYQNLAGTEYKEEISLNGITAVPLTNTGIIAYRAKVSEVGSTGYNVGTITIRVAGAGATLTTIAVGKGQTLCAFYRIPLTTWKGETVNYSFLKNVWATQTKAGSTAACDYVLYTQKQGESRQVKLSFGTSSTGSSTFSHIWERGLMVEPLTEIWMTAESTANDSNVSGGFDMRVFK